MSKISHMTHLREVQVRNLHFKEIMRFKNDKFVNSILTWFKSNKRNFSWRILKLTPYQLLIAEFLLQKTIAKRVEKIFSNFIKKYPHAKSIIELKEESLAKELKYLGLFNRRARDLKKTAQIIVTNNNEIPNTKEGLMALPGVGAYIANAILCFGFNKPVPILDTNVGRIFKRVYTFPVKGAPSRDKSLAEKISHMIPERNFKEFNYALLDFAALVCLPRKPKCNGCPMVNFCDYFVKLKVI